jgi:molecular chaperone DnaJ
VNWQSENLYERLGVNRTATADEIKQAHRELARAYHPDALTDPKDKELGEKILSAENSAYDVLKDDQQRAQYDQQLAGPSILQFRRSSRAPQFFRQALRLSFGDAIFGGRKTLTIPTTTTCRKCQGHGTHDGKPPAACRLCMGRGLIAEGFFPLPCPACGGAGYMVTNPCRQCGGSGQVANPSTITVNIPGGIDDGAVVDVKTGFGVVVLVIKVDDDPLMHRDGSDLHVTIPISMKTAALGGVVKVPTLKGVIDKKVRPGTQPEDVEKMVGAGVNGRGDLFIHYKVIIPRSLSSKERGVLQKMDDKYMRSTDDLWKASLDAFQSRITPHIKK